MILLHTIRYRRRESVPIILCLVWSMENVHALDIVSSHESHCQNGRAIMEESNVLKWNRQRFGSPTNTLTWGYSVLALNFLRILLFVGPSVKWSIWFMEFHMSHTVSQIFLMRQAIHIILYFLLSEILGESAAFLFISGTSSR